MQREHVEAVMNEFKVAGQSHVFRFWDELSDQQRSRLIAQASSIDLPQMAELARQFVVTPHANSFRGRIEPAEIIPIPQVEHERRQARVAKQRGEQALRAGSVAALLVAGGQATRLGFAYPKGMFQAGPISGKTLFQLHAEKILAARRKYDAAIPWYIMTSDSNHEETVRFFENRQYFGLSQEDVFFFKQGMIPALDERGKLLLDEKGHIFGNPDGHGGSLLALKRSGALGDMRQRGIELVSYFQVDNVLIKICDPVFLGYHLLREAEMSAKVVRKRNPAEKVGIVGRVNGRLAVIEYSDMSEEDAQARNPDGSLRYWAGSIAIHIFNLDFIERETKGELRLPFHVAHKKIPYVDASGQQIEPDGPNGYKFERFVFDALGDARTAAVMEVVRDNEFSPIKNPAGLDSPSTATRDMTRLFGNWLEAAGRIVPRDSGGEVNAPIEISPLFALDAEELSERLPEKLCFDNGLYLESA